MLYPSPGAAAATQQHHALTTPRLEEPERTPNPHVGLLELFLAQAMRRLPAPTEMMPPNHLGCRTLPIHTDPRATGILAAGVTDARIPGLRTDLRCDS